MRRTSLHSRNFLSSVALKLAVVAVLVIGLARAGASYFVCPAMEMISSAPCCAHCALDDDDQAPAVHHAPCCARDHVRALPSATTAVAVSVLDAPLAATIAPVCLGAPTPRTDAIAHARASGRAGPPPKDTHASRLMVFRL